MNRLSPRSELSSSSVPASKCGKLHRQRPWQGRSVRLRRVESRYGARSLAPNVTREP